MRSPAISKTAPNGDVDRRLRATQPSMPSPAKTTPSRIIDGSARSTGRKWIMAMTTKSRMSRAIVMRFAILDVATPRGTWVRLAASAAARGRADATDYLPQNGKTARRRDGETGDGKSTRRYVAVRRRHSEASVAVLSREVEESGKRTQMGSCVKQSAEVDCHAWQTNGHAPSIVCHPSPPSGRITTRPHPGCACCKRNTRHVEP